MLRMELRGGGGYVTFFFSGRGGGYVTFLSQRRGGGRVIFITHYWSYNNFFLSQNVQKAGFSEHNMNNPWSDGDSLTL